MAGYDRDARGEVNQSFEYVGKSVPLLKRHPCEHSSSITSTYPFIPYSLASDALRIDLCQKNSNSFPRQWRMGRRLSPFQVAIGHSSVNAVKATARGWSTGSSTCLTFSLHSHTSSTRREGSGYHVHEHRRLNVEEKRTH